MTGGKFEIQTSAQDSLVKLGMGGAHFQVLAMDAVHPSYATVRLGANGQPKKPGTLVVTWGRKVKGRGDEQRNIGLCTTDPLTARQDNTI